MSATLAFFLDSYRAINAKRLFWVALVLSALVVAVFGAAGVNEQGLTFLWWDIPAPINSNMIAPEDFYKFAFAALAVPYWLGWIACILALVSTAGVFPDFLAGGAVDLVLAKPLSRTRIFLTKYAAALLFVGLQVLVFSLASFLVIGFRGGAWEPAIFLAVPLILLLYSYLYSVCVLIGLLTRSPVAALLLTLLFWFVIFGVHTTESTLLMFRTMAESRVDAIQQDIVEREARLEGRPEDGEEGGNGIVNALRGAIDANTAQAQLETRRKQLERAREDVEPIERWHGYFYLVKTVLPKTAETVGLLERSLIDLARLPEMGEEDEPVRMEFSQADDGELPPPPVQQGELASRVEEAVRARPIWWVIGTSLLFEGFILALCVWKFRRTDY